MLKTQADYDAQMVRLACIRNISQNNYFKQNKKESNLSSAENNPFQITGEFSTSRYW